MDRIFIELVTRDDGCQAVRIKLNDQWVETGWLIGEGINCAREIVRKVTAAYPGVPQTHVGFIA